MKFPVDMQCLIRTKIKNLAAVILKKSKTILIELTTFCPIKIEKITARKLYYSGVCLIV